MFNIAINVTVTEQKMTEKNNGTNWSDWQKLMQKIVEQQSQIIKPTITPALKEIQETVPLRQSLKEGIPNETSERG
tara:strand:- start:26334 stop:26561 length:228 start_codon:yes stop_codon:yes gene_type:complete